MVPVILKVNKNSDAKKYISSLLKLKGLSKGSVFYIKPKGKNNKLLLEQVKVLRRSLNLNTKETRVIILYGFCDASSEVQNAMLKTLEEKSNSNIFILICSSVSSVLPTVLSRCKIIKINDSVSKIENSVLNLDHILSDFTNFPIFAKKDDAVLFIKNIINALRIRLLNNDKNSIVGIKKSFEVLRLIDRYNLKYQLGVDNLLFFLRKLYTE